MIAKRYRTKPKLRLFLLTLLCPVTPSCGAASQPAAASSPPRANTGQASPDRASSPVHGAGHGHAHGHRGDHHQAAAPLGHRFERAEQWAARFDAPGRSKWQKPADVVALMDIQPGMTVADIGAGTGYFLPYLAPAVGPRGKLLALDIEPDMVRYMKERAARAGLSNVEPRTVKVDDPQLPAASVDRILIVNTWHHIPNREQYAARLAAALRPGGAIYVVDYTMESPRGPPRAHRIAARVVLRELTTAGLDVAVRSDVLPDQFIAIARLP